MTETSVSQSGQTPEQALATHIVEQATKQGVKAEVTINAFPPHIVTNLMEFLRRARCDGTDAFAWVEAYTFLQQHAPQPTQGVPFTPVPPVPPKAA